MTSRTKYAKSGDVHIAYRTIGDGPVDLVVVEQWFSNIEIERDVAPLARFNDRLSEIGRVIRFDKRGVGLSDPVPATALPPMEQWMEDLHAVMDAVGSARATVVAGMAGGFMGTMFAATYPERTTSLVLVDAFAKFEPSADHLVGSASSVDRLATIADGWGSGVMLPLFAPDLAGDAAIRESWARYERHSVSPGTATAMVEMIDAVDVRAILPAIRVPTLVVSRTDSPVPPSQGRYLASAIDGASYLEVPGASSLIWAGDQDRLVEEIGRLVRGTVEPSRFDRALATVVFTDIVGSTERAAALGDARWLDLLATHDRVVRGELARTGGREMKTTGDGFLATFDGPGRAIRAALAIRNALRAIDVDVRIGVHTGEVDMAAGEVGGIAVHIAARVMAEAGGGDVLVSSTVKDLVIGSDVTLRDRGAHALKGVPGEWRLFAVAEGGSA